MSELPQSEVARMIGIPQEQYSRIERGSKLRAEDLLAILNWLMTPVAGQPKQAELVEEEESAKS